jgi:type IV pilus assembly protein PilV
MTERKTDTQNGFTLLEVSVATALFSLGLGSFSLLLLLAVQGTVETQHHSIAVHQADSLAEMILMNSDAVGHYVYPVESSPDSCAPGLDCSPEQIAASTLARWQQSLGQQLPGGRGLVCLDSSPYDGDPDNPACSGSGGPVIKILWREPSSNPETGVEVKRVVSNLPIL